MKNFTNNFNSRTNPIWVRFMVIALMFILGAGNAWALSLAKGTYYFDNTNTKFSNCYLYVGPSGGIGTVYCYKMDRVAGTKQIYYKTTSSDITHNGIYVCSEKWWDSSKEDVFKFVYHADGSMTDLYETSKNGDTGTTNWTSGYVYIPNSSKVSVSHYSQTKDVYSWNTSTTFSKTLTLTNKVGDNNTADAGTIEVTKWNSTSSSAGSAYAAWESTAAATTSYTTGYKTALKVTATPKSGYELVSLTVGGTAVSSGYEFEITAATEIVATWKKSCDPPAAPELTNPAAQCGGSITLPAKDNNEFTLNWYYENGSVVENTTITSSGTYFAAAVGECESIERTPYTITINPVPSLTNVGNVTLCSSSTAISVENLIKETGAIADNSATIGLYAENGVEIKGSIDINVDTQTTRTYKLKASTQTCSSDFVSFILTVNPLPNAPSLTSPAPVCEGTTVNLPTGFNWYDAETGGTEVQNTAITVTGTYWAAAMQNGCESATRTRYDVTVNPKPSIGSITQDVALPVPFEDVELTATGVTQGAEVKWYLDNYETPVATGTTYVVTSENAGEVTVKAKAFLNGCESAVASHPVTFSAEDCSDRENTTTTRKTKITCSIPSGWKQISCYTYDSNKREYSGRWPGTVMTSDGNNYSIVIDVDDNMKDLYVIFNNNNNGEQTKDPSPITGGFSYTAGNVGKGQTPTFTKGTAYNESTTTLVPALITAPAVKTVSATSVEGSGVVNFTGKVIKTGCAAATKIYVGYQYKLATEPWPNNVTAGNAKGNLIEVPDADGKTLYETYSTTISGLTDGNYVFRAYIINGYDFTNGNYDQGVYYGIDIPVTVSTKKDPIENLQIKYANDKGDVLQDQNVTYCVRDNAYIKLIYDGSRLKPEDDVINISSTLENTFTLVEGEADLYTFVVKGNETITVNAKNKENTDNPTDELTIKTYAVPVIPSIDIDKTTICSNDPTGAKITVSNPQLDITYQVYRISGENPATTHGAAKKHSEGVLEFNSMKEAGTYYVRAYNEKCPNAIAQSLDEILTVIDADATSISISPETKTVNPWVPVTFTVTKQGNYDYTFSCKEGGNDVTSNMVINKSGDTYVVKFPKPDGASVATNLNGQVKFAEKRYKVEVKLNADVQCGTFEDESTVTLEPVNEICK